MKVLVIGGTGFISSRLVHFLVEAGHAVATLTRGRSATDEASQVERLHADRHDESRLRNLLHGRRFDGVYDMVAYRPEETRSLVEILDGRVDRFIHCSTISVYMVSKNVRCPITEDQDKLPLMKHWAQNPFGMDYGILKRGCEDELWRAHAEDRFQVSMLRPTFVCGPRDPTLRDLFWIERVMDGGPVLVPGSGDFAFQIVFVDDVARAFASLLGNPNAVGKAYNVAAEEILTMNEYLERLGRLLGCDPETVHVPQPIFEQQAFSSNPRGDVFPFNVRRTTVFSLDAIHRDLRFESTPFETWMSDTIEWYGQQRLGRSLGYGLRKDEVAFAREWKRRESHLRE